MAIAKQRQRIENAWQQSASPFPMPKPQRRWLLITAGVIAGIALSRAQLWLTSPVTPEEQQEECRFKVPRLHPDQLEPVMPPELARRWAPGGDLHKFLGDQLPKTAKPQPSTTDDDPCSG